MLHRTQAIQVVPVYERFIALYPDVFALANAPEDEVYALLYPLGLRWRAELLLQMVAHLMKHAPATIPQDKEKLLALPGVSEYIASAVRCFTWEYPDPLIDTNTVRVIGRVFGLEIKDSSRRNAVFRRLTVELVSRDNPRAYNFALLDLAAIVCTKTRHPDCGRCPLLRYCQYGSSSIANEC
jgi:A/G-specific adenine glycosylase